MSTSARPIPREEDATTPREPLRVVPASPPPAKATPEDASAVSSATEDTDEASRETNLVKRTVDEICKLMADVHEIREELLAHGVQFHMLNALIELGVSDKPDEQAKMAQTAVEASVRAHGSQAITREALDDHLVEIVTLEKSLRHVRHVASRQGVHMQALNHLTQLMRLNPGDGGVQAINTFVAYADAAGVPLERVAGLRAQIADEPESVLPNIPREEETRGQSLRAWLADLAVGAALTAGVMWLVL